jgi:hypothetical protein
MARLIDTPDIGGARGVGQDQKTMEVHIDTEELRQLAWNSDPAEVV